MRTIVEADNRTGQAVILRDTGLLRCGRSREAELIKDNANEVWFCTSIGVRTNAGSISPVLSVRLFLAMPFPLPFFSVIAHLDEISKVPTRVSPETWNQHECGVIPWRALLNELSG